MIAALCEISALALLSVESTLLATKTVAPARRQDASVLMESAKSVLFTQTNEKESSAGGTTKTTAQTRTVAAQYESTPSDVWVFAEDSTLEELRRCFLSLRLLEDVDHVYVLGGAATAEREALIAEFGLHAIDTFENVPATTQSVLVCRGTDVLYPDAIKIARTYEMNDKTFLELRSVYSDESALGTNGVLQIDDKRQMVREALSTRGLSTWSTGPALVPSTVLTKTARAQSAEMFFRMCERTGVHGTISDEIISEEISHEQTVAEVQWRALDFRYTSRTWMNSYSGHGLIGATIKLWSTLVNVSLVRRIVAIALVLAFVIDPSVFEFVTTSYLAVGATILAAVLAGGYLAGDRRAITARVREFYFDVEASMYNLYQSLIKPSVRKSDQSIVKKLPSVSFLLILADAVLVYRVAQQYDEVPLTVTENTLRNISMFSGYVLIVSLLVGLGMVIVRQSRTALRREISRGANINSEPVSMIDLSPGGAGCISVSSLEVGSDVEFVSSLPVGNENAKFTCTAQVRSCVEWEGSYRVGLSFSELPQDQLDILETYCSIVYPHAQAREVTSLESPRQAKVKVNGKAEKRFLSYAASFIALSAIIFSNISMWQ